MDDDRILNKLLEFMVSIHILVFPVAHCVKPCNPCLFSLVGRRTVTWSYKRAQCSQSKISSRRMIRTQRSGWTNWTTWASSINWTLTWTCLGTLGRPKSMMLCDTLLFRSRSNRFLSLSLFFFSLFFLSQHLTTTLSHTQFDRDHYSSQPLEPFSLCLELNSLCAPHAFFFCPTS